MGLGTTDIRSETGWDALSDGLPMVVRALAGPATLEEVASAAGEADLVVARKRLSRLVREGILVQVGDRFQAPSRLITTVRQEGLITSLSRHVLPAVTRLAAFPESGLAIQLDLELEIEEQERLRRGPVEELVKRLNELSDQHAEQRSPWLLTVYGTSDVPPPAPRGERLLETLKRSAKERSSGERAARAVLMCYEAQFGDPNAARALVEDIARGLEARTSRQRHHSQANYTLVFGFSPSGSQDGDVR